MALSDGADQNQTTSRILNKLHYAMTHVAADIGTAATGDIVVMLDASDNYEPKYADAANVAEMIAGTDLTAASITGTDSSLGIAGQAAAQGGAVALTGGTSSTAGNAGGAVTATGGTPGATGVGGAVTFAAGIGGATSGAGGVASIAGGAGTAGNSAGGVASVTGGAGQGSAAGGIAKVVGGAGGATGVGGKAQVIGGAGGATSGDGSDAEVTGGAATANNDDGGSVVLTGGAKHGTGADGSVIVRSVLLTKQGAPAAKTTAATLTAAEIIGGLLTANQGGAAAADYTLPLAADVDTALPDSAANDAFEFSLINISTNAAEDITVVTNTGWTLVGEMTVESNDADRAQSSGRFLARKTGSGAWTLYRIA